MENKFNEELIAKARQAKSPEELLTLAKENDQELTEEEAKAYFEQLNKSGELSDDELSDVAGGGCQTGGPLLTGRYDTCKYWCCNKCNRNISITGIRHYHGGKLFPATCACCRFSSEDSSGLFLCHRRYY